jgi:uncharacterized membrane protein YciS (DUF1049 family)
MWMIRWFFIALVVAIISIFIGRNLGQNPITIDYVFGVTEEMSPITAMFFAFVAGFLTWFVISLFNFMKMRSELASRDKVIKNLKNELNGFRNASLSVPDIADKTMVLDKKGDKLTEDGDEADSEDRP